MEYKQQTTLIWQTFVCLLLFIVNFNDISAHTHPEIISSQDEVIAYVNHTAKLSCIMQNRNRQHVTWSRVNFINDTQKITGLLYVDLLKYTPFSRYHLTHLIEKENREYWNLEIRHIHPTDQGYYSCVIAAVKPVSRTFFLKVIDNPRNLSLALRSTYDIQQKINSSSTFPISVFTIFLMIILILAERSV